jgi:4-carboxymuconolactone decarboxylase
MPGERAGGRVALRRFSPAELDETQRALYDMIVGGPRGRGPQQFRLIDDEGRLEGPFNAFLLQPVLGGRLQALGGAIRYSTSLSDRAREIAILVVAAHWRSEFEQAAHEAVGRAAGLTDDELRSLRSGADPDADPIWSDPADRLVVRLVRSIVRDGDTDDATYAAAIELVGESGIFELLTLVGYYATLALQLRVFRVAPPNGRVP